MKLTPHIQEKTARAYDNGSILALIALILRYGLDIIEFLIERRKSK